MTVETSARHSPLQDRVDLSAACAAVQVSETAFLAQLSLRLDPSSPASGAVGEVLGARLPTTPNTAAVTPVATTLWLGPDEWLVVAAPEVDAEELEKSLRVASAGEHAAVVDVSAHRTTLELQGARAREVLAKGCSLDLHPRSFGLGSCAQTVLARSPIILLACSADATAYRLFVRASFAAYVADWLFDASIEYADRP